MFDMMIDDTVRFNNEDLPFVATLTRGIPGVQIFDLMVDGEGCGHVYRDVDRMVWTDAVDGCGFESTDLPTVVGTILESLAYCAACAANGD